MWRHSSSGGGLLRLSNLLVARNYTMHLSAMHSVLSTAYVHDSNLFIYPILWSRHVGPSARPVQRTCESARRYAYNTKSNTRTKKTKKRRRKEIIAHTNYRYSYWWRGQYEPAPTTSRTDPWLVGVKGYDYCVCYTMLGYRRSKRLHLVVVVPSG